MFTTLIFLALATLTQAQNLCLSSHNQLRALHEQTGPMVWDAELAAGATEWAQKLAREGGLSHSAPEGAYGENLYSSTGAAPNCARATLAWYNEIKDYDFSNGSFDKSTGHFTQVVWKASTKLGVGIAQKGDRVVICARYAPPGNYNSMFAANVLPQKEGAKTPTLAQLESNIMPVTEGPVTEEPMTEGPMTEEPVTEGPVTEEPVTEGPVTEEPVTEEPVTEEPMTEGPMTEGPEPMTKPSGCQDKSERCKKVNGTKCGGWAKKACRKTCNTCKPPKPTGEPKECEDKSKRCKNFVGKKCGGWARNKCPKTCNTCKPPMPTGME